MQYKYKISIQSKYLLIINQGYFKKPSLHVYNFNIY